MRFFQMEYLKAVCDTGSISKAADILRISRPAVSKALRELEGEYDVKLFARTSSGITLTEAGCAFYKKCSEIQKLLNSVQSEMEIFRENAKKKDKNRLKIGLSPATGFAVFPDFAAKLLARDPNIIIEPIEMSRPQSILMLEEGSIDACLSVTMGSEDDNFRKIKIKEVELFFCCNIHHRLAEKACVDIDDIKDEPIIMLHDTFLRGQSGMFMKMYVDAGRTLVSRYQTTQVSMARSMVANGLCCTAQFREVMEGNPDIVLIPFKNPIRYTAHVIWNDSVKHSKAFNEMMEFLAD